LSNSAIAIRYAKALITISVEEKKVDQYAESVVSMAELLKKEDLLRLLLDSPTFPLEKKKAIASDIGKLLEFSEGMQNFIALLLEKGRIIYLPDIAANYCRLADDLSGVVRAKITTANDLAKTKIDSIRKGLEKQTGKKVILSVAKDENLIGGIQAEMDGKLFDGSVKTQLKRIADTLAKG